MSIRLVYEDRAYLRRPGETLETDLGVLEVPADVHPGDELDTHLGHTFTVHPIRGPDCFEHFERTGAPLLPRDVGLILGETGAGMGDRVLDVGTGTGVLAAALANVGAAVTSYERSPEAAAVAQSNLDMAGLEEQVDVRTADARTAIEDGALGRFDVITLDTADAPSIVAAAPDLLFRGGFVAAYSPFVEDARAIVEAAREGLSDVRAVETIQRTLDVDSRGTRPSTHPVGHSGYLTFARRV